MATARCTGVVRQFSTSAVRRELVSAPIKIFGVEGRYATALYSAATKQKKLEAVEGELNKIKDVLTKDSKFNAFIRDPTIKRTVKRDGVSSAVQKLKVSSITKNFLEAMAENGRMGQLDNIMGAFAMAENGRMGQLDNI